MHLTEQVVCIVDDYVQVTTRTHQATHETNTNLFLVNFD